MLSYLALTLNLLASINNIYIGEDAQIIFGDMSRTRNLTAASTQTR